MRNTYSIFLMLALALLLLPSFSPAGESENAQAVGASMDACNRIYHAADYEQAIDCYQKLPRSAAQLFNIGNSYARLDKIGYAVLFYLRALCISPDDADVSANLSHIREQYSLYTPEASMAEQLFSLQSITHWSLLCLLAPLIYLVFSGVRLLRSGQNPRWLEIIMLCGCLGLFALGGAGSWYHYQKWQRSVVVEDTRLLISPFDKAESVGAISQGRLVRPQKTYQDYIHVIDETGRKGWLRRDQQVRILEEAAP